MSNERRLVYLETSVFVAHIKGEQGRAEDCTAVMMQAEAGEFRAITSTVTLAEVIKVPGGYLPESVDTIIESLFKREWLYLVQLDRLVASRARQLSRTHHLKPLDAIHVASALSRGAEKLLTYDGDILKIGSLEGMTICQPSGQRVLQLQVLP